MEETNKIRISLGLKPLTDDSTPANDKEKEAEENYAKQREREAKEREAKEREAREREERERAEMRGRMQDLEEQVRDLMVFIEVGRRIEDATEGEEAG